jgi:hypothetical protein
MRKGRLRDDRLPFDTRRAILSFLCNPKTTFTKHCNSNRALFGKQRSDLREASFTYKNNVVCRVQRKDPEKFERLLSEHFLTASGEYLNVTATEEAGSNPLFLSLPAISSPTQLSLLSLASLPPSPSSIAMSHLRGKTSVNSDSDDDSEEFISSSTKFASPPTKLFSKTNKVKSEAAAKNDAVVVDLENKLNPYGVVVSVYQQKQAQIQGKLKSLTAFQFTQLAYSGADLDVLQAQLSEDGRALIVDVPAIPGGFSSTNLTAMKDKMQQDFDDKQKKAEDAAAKKNKRAVKLVSLINEFKDWLVVWNNNSKVALSKKNKKASNQTSSKLTKEVTFLLPFKVNNKAFNGKHTHSTDPTKLIKTQFITPSGTEAKSAENTLVALPQYFAQWAMVIENTVKNMESDSEEEEDYSDLCFTDQFSGMSLGRNPTS